MRSFDKSYIKMAEIWAENSRAIRNKVGALIVKDNMIISDGFNGTPSGFENECEYVSACKMSMCNNWHNGTCADIHCTHAVLTTKPYVLHAEANAITKLAKSHNSAEGATLYVTLSPCIECAKLIIQAGIKRVVYKELYRLSDGIELLKRAGISVEQINDNMS